VFPQHGQGKIEVGRLPVPRGPGDYPTAFFGVDQTDTQCHLFEYLTRFGTVHCEVDCGDAGRIDLVWEADTHDDTWTIGIEIKTDTSLSPVGKTQSQIKRYTEATLSDLSAASLVSTASGQLQRAEDMYLFDEIWVLLDGTGSRWSGDSPEDGWLTFDSGTLEYTIDDTPARDTIPLDPGKTEAWYTAALWTYYSRRGRCLSTEFKTTLPRHRRNTPQGVKFEVGEVRKPDLIEGKTESYHPMTEDSYIHAIEVKRSLRDRQRLDDQLSIYKNSGMYSHVSLAVPESLLSQAYDFLMDQHPGIGLILIQENGTVRDLSHQEPEQRTLQELPIVQMKPKTDGSYARVETFWGDAR